MQQRTPAEPVVVFVSSALVLLAVAISWMISELAFAGARLDHRFLEVAPALFASPIALAALVTIGVRRADQKLERVPTPVGLQREAHKVPEILQAGIIAFVGGAFSLTAYFANSILELVTHDSWWLPVLFATAGLVTMYYFAHRFIDIDVLPADVRPWMLSAMLTVGSAGLALLKFFPGGSNTGGHLGKGGGSGGSFLPIAIVALFGWLAVRISRWKTTS